MAVSFFCITDYKTQSVDLTCFKVTLIKKKKQCKKLIIWENIHKYIYLSAVQLENLYPICGEFRSKNPGAGFYLIFNFNFTSF